MEKLVGWCRDNHLLLNVSKTKEIVVDFRKHPPDPGPLVINDKEVTTAKDEINVPIALGAFRDKGVTIVGEYKCIPGLRYRLKAELIPERPGPLEEGQPAAVLHEETEVLQRLPQAAATGLQGHSGVSGDILTASVIRQP